MDGFDIRAARKAGASDEDIKQFLVKQTGGKFDVEGAMKAGATLDDISAHVSQRMSQPSEADLANIEKQAAARNMPGALQSAQSPMSNFLAPFRPAAEEWNKNIYGGQNPLAAAAAGVNMAVKGLGGLMQMPVKISELNPSPETVGAHMINYGMGKVAQGIGSGIENDNFSL